MAPFVLYVVALCPVSSMLRVEFTTTVGDLMLFLQNKNRFVSSPLPIFLLLLRHFRRLQFPRVWLLRWFISFQRLFGFLLRHCPPRTVSKSLISFFELQNSSYILFCNVAEKARKSCCDSCASITISLTSSSQPPVHLTCLDCNEKEVHEWACDFCKLNNMTDDPRCIMCGTGCPSLPAELKGSKLNLSTCGLPGCTEPAVYYGFCSKDHLDRAVERNMMPPMIEGEEDFYCSILSSTCYS